MVKILNGQELFHLEKSKNTAGGNSAIAAYFQIGFENSRDNAILDLLYQIISDSFYHQLRTVEQLGYITTSAVKRKNSVQGMLFLIQSGVKQPLYLNERIDAFIISFTKTLNELQEEDFNTFVNSTIALLQEKDKNLSQETNRWWSEIIQNSYRYDKEKFIVAELQKLTKKDLIFFFNERFLPQGAKRKKLSAQIFAEDIPAFKPAYNQILITDPVQFKRRSNLYPLA